MLGIEPQSVSSALALPLTVTHGVGFQADLNISGTGLEPSHSHITGIAGQVTRPRFCFLRVTFCKRPLEFQEVTLSLKATLGIDTIFISSLECGVLPFI